MADLTFKNFPIYGSLMERAPGLKLDHLDRMLRDAWAEGFEAGVTDMRPEIDAHEKRQRAIVAAVQQVIKGRLNHIKYALKEDQIIPRKKTTIAAERAFMEAKAIELANAISDLEKACADA